RGVQRVYGTRTLRACACAASRRPRQGPAACVGLCLAAEVAGLVRERHRACLEFQPLPLRWFGPLGPEEERALVQSLTLDPETVLFRRQAGGRARGSRPRLSGVARPAGPGSGPPPAARPLGRGGEQRSDADRERGSPGSP